MNRLFRKRSVEAERACLDKFRPAVVYTCGFETEETQVAKPLDLTPTLPPITDICAVSHGESSTVNRRTHLAGSISGGIPGSE